MSETIFQSYISVSQMSEQLNISRVHFYSLLKRGIFPQPIKRNGCRPFYDPEGQRTCHEIKEKQIGIDGQPILFYSKTDKSKKESKEKTSKYTLFVDTLTELGLSGVTSKEVEATIKRLYPSGTAQTTEETLIRELFIDFSTRNE